MLRTSEIRRAACKRPSRDGRHGFQQPAQRPQRRSQLMKNVIETVALKLEQTLTFDGIKPVAEESRRPRPQDPRIDRPQAHCIAPTVFEDRKSGVAGKMW